MRKEIFYTDTEFDGLPKGVPKDELLSIVAEFKSNDFTRRDFFILAHTRLATVVALEYGYKYKCMDELIDVVLVELCEFPQRVASGALRDDKVISYLLSRLHTVCTEYVRHNSCLPVPHASIIRRGKKKTTRVELPKDNNVTESDSYYVTEDVNSDFVNDLFACVVTDREAIVLKMTLEGHTDREIIKAFGLRGPSIVKSIKDTIFNRYKLRDLDHMQTFLPSADYAESAKCLDYRRLGKQRVECKQLLLGQFNNHPASKMWRGHEYELCTYAIEITSEWLDRGYNDTLLEWFAVKRKEYKDSGPPVWLGDKRLHESHQSNLLRKDYEHYSKFGWLVKDNIPYWWPS